MSSPPKRSFTFLSFFFSYVSFFFSFWSIVFGDFMVSLITLVSCRTRGMDATWGMSVDSGDLLQSVTLRIMKQNLMVVEVWVEVCEEESGITELRASLMVSFGITHALVRNTTRSKPRYLV